MKRKQILIFISFLCFFLVPDLAISQCCSGGSGCTIAGNVSEGVLQHRQMELSSSFQFIHTDLFYKKDKQAAFSERTFDSFSSSYQYFKIGYGITPDFTISFETGYYLGKKETGLDANSLTTYSSKGFGDILIFPKYNVFNRQIENHQDGMTLGLGYKLPLGAYNDSTGNVEPFSGQIFYVTNPTSVQLSSGAQDVVFYTLLSRRYLREQLSFFVIAYYVLKGYNPNGEKLGNYASIGLFVSKNLLEKIGLGVQVRYEQVQRMKINESVFLFGRPSSYYPEATGYKKVFITPQITLTTGQFSVFASSDFPVYQYLNTSPYYTQAASDFQATFGVSYSFNLAGTNNPL